MARLLKYNFVEIFAILLSTTVLVNSLPTSVLVDTKQQQNEQSTTGGLNKEHHHSANMKSSSPSSSVEHENPIMADKALPKLHAQKRGVKQSFFEPPGMPSDILFNNNAPAGIWDDPDGPYSEFQDIEDYPQYYQPPFSLPHHQQQQQQQSSSQQRPYENFQHIMSSDNLYDEPLALPVKYKYPTRFFDERRKRGVNKNIMRLKRDSTKLNSADMLALLQFLESNQHKHYGNDDLNSLEYQKPFNGPYGSNFGGAAAATSNFNNGDDGDDDFDDGVNDGEWWNGEWIEPSVQYYGNRVRNHFNDENTRKRLTTLPVFPAKKRFMIAKKKRSLGLHHASDDVAAMVSKKSTLGSRFTNDNSRA